MICGTAWNTVPFGLIHVYVPMSAENPRCYSGILHMSVKASCRHIYHIENKISNNILSAISINKQIKSQQIQQSLKISHKHVIYNTHTIHHTNTKTLTIGHVEPHVLSTTFKIPNYGQLWRSHSKPGMQRLRVD